MLKALIKNQKIRVDAHKWGTGESVRWDSASEDIHIDKETVRRIQGRSVKVRIKIPINSDRSVQVGIIGTVKYIDQATAKARKEIVEEIVRALSDKQVREAFVNDLLKIMENYPGNLSSLEKARSAVNRLASHFGLSGDIKEEILRHAERKLTAVITVFREAENSYFITLGQGGITIGQNPLPVDTIRSRRR